MKLIVADRYALFREGLKSLLESEAGYSVVAEASSVYQLMPLAQAFHPDVIIVEDDLMDGCGIQSMKAILARFPHISFVILDNGMPSEYLLDILLAGAKGVLKKNVSKKVLIASLHALDRGEAIIPRRMVTMLLNELCRSKRGLQFPPQDLSGLTFREYQVFKLLGLDITNREIASQLKISENTVRVHMHNILEKLHLRSRREAIEIAMRTCFEVAEHAPEEAAHEEAGPE